MGDALFVVMRWLHMASMATLVGGMLYGRTVESKSPSNAASAFRPYVVVAMAGLIISGTFNLLQNPGHTPKYHMLLGIKLLLALHVFAVAFISTSPVNNRRRRQMTGVAISGLLILAISAYLRRIF
jgi:putative copper export protein